MRHDVHHFTLTMLCDVHPRSLRDCSRSSCIMATTNTSVHVIASTKADNCSVHECGNCIFASRVVRCWSPNCSDVMCCGKRGAGQLAATTALFSQQHTHTPTTVCQSLTILGRSTTSSRRGKGALPLLCCHTDSYTRKCPYHCHRPAHLHLMCFFELPHFAREFARTESHVHEPLATA